jgi:hypothetical protein
VSLQSKVDDGDIGGEPGEGTRRGEVVVGRVLIGCATLVREKAERVTLSEITILTVEIWSGA